MLDFVHPSPAPGLEQASFDGARAEATEPGLETESSDTRGGAPRPNCLAVPSPRDPSLDAGNDIQFTCLSPQTVLG